MRLGALVLSLVLGGCENVIGPVGKGPGIDPGPGNPPPATPLTIVTSALPEGTVGQPYGQHVQASGGVIPYRWTVAEGELPAGLRLDLVDGYISGTPSVTGRFTFVVRVATSAGNATKLLALDVQ